MGGHVFTLVIISAEVRRSIATVRMCIGVCFKTTANLWESEVYQLEQREQIDETRSTRVNP